MINDIKTEFLIIGSRHQLAKTTIDSIVVGESHKASEILDRGLMLKCVWMYIYTRTCCSRVFHGLCKIRQIRKLLHTNTTKTLVHSLVSSHLDYCNALLFGSPKYQLERAWVIFVLEHYLFLKANSYPQVALSENFSEQITVGGQIYQHIFAPNGGYCLHMDVCTVTQWREQRGMDSYLQWQISQSDCEISSNCGK